MENNNQRIIFLVPEDTTPAKIILDILKKNGINNPTDDIGNKSKTPKLVIMNNATKDFFEKKLTEEKLSGLLQGELKVSKENATGIISGIKERLLPFAKKITIPNGKEQVKSAEQILNTPKQDMNIVSPIKETSPTSDKKIVTPPLKRTKKETLAKKNEGFIPQTKQTSGPDDYREPIE